MLKLFLEEMKGKGNMIRKSFEKNSGCCPFLFSVCSVYMGSSCFGSLEYTDFVFNSYKFCWLACFLLGSVLGLHNAQICYQESFSIKLFSHKCNPGQFSGHLHFEFDSAAGQYCQDPWSIQDFCKIDISIRMFTIYSYYKERNSNGNL